MKWPHLRFLPLGRVRRGEHMHADPRTSVNLGVSREGVVSLSAKRHLFPCKTHRGASGQIGRLPTPSASSLRQRVDSANSGSPRVINMVNLCGVRAQETGAVMRFHFSTDDLPVRDREQFYFDVFAKQVMKITLVDRPDPATFRAQFDACVAGRFTLVDFQTPTGWRGGPLQMWARTARTDITCSEAIESEPSSQLRHRVTPQRSGFTPAISVSSRADGQVRR
jgi:hypothetical protein